MVSYYIYFAYIIINKNSLFDKTIMDSSEFLLKSSVNKMFKNKQSTKNIYF